MPSLPDALRAQLEKAVIEARDVAEDAAAAALRTLAVDRDSFFPAMNEEQKRQRRALRAKAAQLGGEPIKYGGIRQGWDRLVEEVAYEVWHRMLFARFLAENNLLMHPEGVAVTLAECDELAAEESAAGIDGWDLAARYAARMVPGLFLQDDPAAHIRFAPEGRRRLEAILTGLPAPIFTADDSLGWVYQFWQSKKKDEVNRSERKIGGADLYPVTQLFTEDYMVQFLLQNSLGAWWAARHPHSPLIAQWSYLRWQDEAEETQGEGQGTPDAADSGDAQLATRNSQSTPRLPAAGTFPGWPDRAAAVTMMDPCGGSGHFVVAGFEMLRRMRMEEEGLNAADAADAVIRDNLFMLEIDPRCTQIAAFALALAAWKAGGYRDLPTPNIACSGIAVEGQLDDWLHLAGDDARLRAALERLYHLFKQAPTLGSLINPADVPAADRLFSADYHEVAPLLEAALAKESERDDPAAAVLGDAARGVLKATQLLARKYTLVATNVPYLTRGRHVPALMEYCDAYYPDSKSDLTTVFVERCRTFTLPNSTYATVSLHYWLLLDSYVNLRKKMLGDQVWNLVCPLGADAFQTITGQVVKVVLTLLTNKMPADDSSIYTINGIESGIYSVKSAALRSQRLLSVSQLTQLNNQAHRILLNTVGSQVLLSKYAFAHEGLSRGDKERFDRCFWEFGNLDDPNWSRFINSPSTNTVYGGREIVVFWENGNGELSKSSQARIAGTEAWGSNGVFVARTSLRSSLFQGELYAQNGAVILPKNPQYLPAIWVYCQSSEYRYWVNILSQKTIVPTGTMNEVPFDLDYWQSVAEEQYPDGLPEPWSNDPTQWLFEGHPVGSTEPLHVAVARLLGYRWPAAAHSGNERNDRNESNESPPDDLDPFADADGIVCLPAVAGEQPATQRLRALLAHAYNHPPHLPDFEKYRVGDHVPSSPVMPQQPQDDAQPATRNSQFPTWSAQVERALLDAADAEGRDLDYWLNYKFFAQHARLFGNRPFLWHIWDGRNDGFSAIVNYHKLDAATLDKLIYTYLGTWIRDQRAAVARGEAGADARLSAAEALKEKLEAIRTGEPPHDIYVRWKALHEQPIGWNPDLNDGVRQNIRPFVEAGVLRRSFTINWTKDRGKNPDGSERLNDLHYTRAEKAAARQQQGDA